MQRTVVSFLDVCGPLSEHREIPVAHTMTWERERLGSSPAPASLGLLHMRGTRLTLRSQTHS